MPVKQNLFFQKFVAEEVKKGVINEVKALNKKVEEFCKIKNLALIRHSDVNQNCLAKKNNTYMKIVYIRQAFITKRLLKFETKVSETICVELIISKKKWWHIDLRITT